MNYNAPMRPILLTFLILAALTGCAGMKEGFEKGFDKSFAESCRAEAIKQGADKQLADRYCDCTLKKFKETKSMDQSTKTCAAESKAAPR